MRCCGVSVSFVVGTTETATDDSLISSANRTSKTIDYVDVNHEASESNDEVTNENYEFSTVADVVTTTQENLSNFPTTIGFNETNITTTESFPTTTESSMDETGTESTTENESVITTTDIASEIVHRNGEIIDNVMIYYPNEMSGKKKTKPDNMPIDANEFRIHDDELGTDLHIIYPTNKTVAATKAHNTTKPIETTSMNSSTIFIGPTTVTTTNAPEKNVVLVTPSHELITSNISTTEIPISSTESAIDLKSEGTELANQIENVTAKWPLYKRPKLKRKTFGTKSSTTTVAPTKASTSIPAYKLKSRYRHSSAKTHEDSPTTSSQVSIVNDTTTRKPYLQHHKLKKSQNHSTDVQRQNISTVNIASEHELKINALHNVLTETMNATSSHNITDFLIQRRINDLHQNAMRKILSVHRATQPKDANIASKTSTTTSPTISSIEADTTTEMPTEQTTITTTDTTIESLTTTTVKSLYERFNRRRNPFQGMNRVRNNDSPATSKDPNIPSTTSTTSSPAKSSTEADTTTESTTARPLRERFYRRRIPFQGMNRVRNNISSATLNSSNIPSTTSTTTLPTLISTEADSTTETPIEDQATTIESLTTTTARPLRERFYRRRIPFQGINRIRTNTSPATTSTTTETNSASTSGPISSNDIQSQPYVVRGISRRRRPTNRFTPIASNSLDSVTTAESVKGEQNVQKIRKRTKIERISSSKRKLMESLRRNKPTTTTESNAANPLMKILQRRRTVTTTEVIVQTKPTKKFRRRRPVTTTTTTTTTSEPIVDVTTTVTEVNQLIDTSSVEPIEFTTIETTQQPTTTTTTISTAAPFETSTQPTFIENIRANNLNDAIVPSTHSRKEYTQIRRPHVPAASPIVEQTLSTASPIDERTSISEFKPINSQLMKTETFPDMRLPNEEIRPFHYRQTPTRITHRRTRIPSTSSTLAHLANQIGQSSLQTETFSRPLQTLTPTNRRQVNFLPSNAPFQYLTGIPSYQTAAPIPHRFYINQNLPMSNQFNRFTPNTFNVGQPQQRPVSYVSHTNPYAGQTAPSPFGNFKSNPNLVDNFNYL